MKIKHPMIAGTAALLIGCAHADGFSGRWIDTSQGNPFTVSNLGNGHHSAAMQRETPNGAGVKVHWTTVAVYAFTRHGDRLEGHLQHAPMLTFTLKHKGAGHLMLIGHVLRGRIVFRRSH